MNDPHAIDRKQIGQRRRKRLVLIIIIASFIWAGATWYDQQKTLIAKQEELKKVEQQYKQLQLEHEELSYEVTKLYDKEYIAEIARKDYHLSKPGEVIFIIPE